MSDQSQALEDQFPPGRNSLAVYLLLLSIISGIAFIVRVVLGVEGALATVLPLPLEVMWNLVLFGGALLAAVGVYWRDPVYGRLLERSGLIALGFAAIGYGLAIAFARGVAGTFSAS